MKKLIIAILILQASLIYGQINEGLGVVGYDTCYFDEATCDYLSLDTTISENIWRLGQPQKVLFNSAYSLPKAIITDTINAYPAGNHSYFDVVIDYINLPFYGNFVFSFFHKMNTDTLTEGGYLEISYDKGLSWTNIVFDTENWMFNTENCYSQTDTITSGIPAFTGNISEWTRTRLQWIYDLPVKGTKWSTDTIIIRFNFVSDDVETAKEGWVIDNFSFDFVQMGGSLNDLALPENIFVFPNPSTGIINFKSDNYKIKHLDIYNANGLPVSSYKYILNNLFIFEEEISPGVYFYKAELEKKNIVE